MERGPAGLGTPCSEAGGGVAASPGGFVLEMGRGELGPGSWKQDGRVQVRFREVTSGCGARSSDEMASTWTSGRIPRQTRG